MKLTSKFKRIMRSMPILSWLVLLLLLIPIGESSYWKPFSTVFFAILSVSGLFIMALIICYLLRFYLIRNRVNIIFSLLLTVLIFFFPYFHGLTASRVYGTFNSILISDFAILFLFLPIIAGYKILRIENIEDAIKKQLTGRA